MKVEVKIKDDKGVYEFGAIIVEENNELSFDIFKMNSYCHEQIVKTYEKIDLYNPLYMKKDLTQLLDFFIQNKLNVKYKILSEIDVIS